MLSRNWAEPAWQAQDRVQPGELTCVLLSYVLLNNATKTSPPSNCAFVR